MKLINGIKNKRTLEFCFEKIILSLNLSKVNGLRSKQ